MEKAAEYRSALLEAVAETDDALLEKLLRRRRAHGRRDQGRASASSPSPARSTRCSAARRSRTAACSRCSTPSSTTCRRRSTCPPSRRTTRSDEETIIERHADPTEPFSALAFKVAMHPFFGRLTYIRVYSGHLDSRWRRSSTRPRARRSASGRSSRCTPTRRSRSTSVTAGHIYAVIGLKDTTTGDTLCDPHAPGRARVDDVPRARHRGRDRAEDQGRPGEAGCRHPEARRRGPDVPHRAEPGDRPDGHQGHGRAPPRHPRRPHEARVQRRGQRRQAAGGVPRDDPRAVEKHDYTHKKQTGGSGQFAKVQIALEPLEVDGRQDVRVREQGHRWPHPARVHPARSTPGIQDAMQVGVLAGYPMVGVKAILLDGAYARRRLLGDGVQDRRLDGASRRPLARRTPFSSSRSWPSRCVLPRSTWATSSAT